MAVSFNTYKLCVHRMAYGICIDLNLSYTLHLFLQMIRDGRSQLSGQMKCVRSRITEIRDYTLNHKSVRLSHDGNTYLVKVSLIPVDELNTLKNEDCFYQVITSGGIRSICDVLRDERRKR